MALINKPPIRAGIASKTGVMPNTWAEWFNQVYTIVFAVQQSGPTSQRPVDNLFTGRPYFDTTLGKPIWYKTAGWVDATGGAV
jgi:hypothetical protein